MNKPIAITLFAVLLAARSIAAPPVNDNFTNAIALTDAAPLSTVDNSEATNEAADPVSTVGYRTVWWTYRPTANGRLTISTTGSANHPKHVCVFLGTTLASLRAVIFDQSEAVTTFTFPVTANVDYRICVGSQFSGTGSFYGGSVTMGISLDAAADVSFIDIPYAATMANDAFAQRILLTGSNLGAVGYNASATNEGTGNEPASSGFRTLWWTYRPNATGRVTLSTTGSDTFPKSLAVYLGSNVASLRAVATSRNVATASITFPVTANTDYHISVGSHFDGNYDGLNSFYGGSIVLSGSLDDQADISYTPFPTPAAAANDNFGARVVLPGGTVYAIGYNRLAAREGLEPAATKERTIWWDWTAPAAGTTTIDLTGSDAISKWVTVWRGAGLSSLTQVAVAGPAPRPSVSFTATAGETYHIAVGNNSTEEGGSIVLGIAGPPGSPGSEVPSMTIAQAVRLRWATVLGLRYRVQKSFDMTTWTSVGSEVLGDGNLKDYFEPIGGAPAFFRVFLQP
jgi:hypothetical protein